MDNPNQQFINHYPIQYKINRKEEDDIDITETKNPFNKQSITDDRSSTKEDNNRKF